MPIYLGGGEIDEVYVGSSEADAVYYQGEKVWPSAVPFEPVLVTITTPGPFEEPWVAGATKCDVVLCSAGGPGGWGNTGSSGLPTYLDLPYLEAWNGSDPSGGMSGDSMPTLIYNGQEYVGGAGGSTPGEYLGGTGMLLQGDDGQQPGGGGAGYTETYPPEWETDPVEYPGGPSGAWETFTMTLEEALNEFGVDDPGQVVFTGYVGEGVQPSGSFGDGGGGHGIAHFWFYT